MPPLERAPGLDRCSSVDISGTTSHGPASHELITTSDVELAEINGKNIKDYDTDDVQSPRSPTIVQITAASDSAEPRPPADGQHTGGHTERHYSTLLVILTVAIMITASATNTIVTKLLGYVRAPGADGVERNFEHPFIIGFFSVVGKVALFLLWLFRVLSKRYIRHEPLEAMVDYPSPAMPRRYYFLPGLVDAAATCAWAFGLMFSDAGTFAMLRSVTIPATALTARVWFGRRYQRYELLSIAGLLVGSIIAGAASMTGFGVVGAKANASSSAAPNPVLGAVLVVVCSLLYGLLAGGLDHIALDVYGVPAPLHSSVDGAIAASIFAAVIGLVQLLDQPPDNLADFMAQSKANGWIPAGCMLTCVAAAVAEAAGAQMTMMLSGTVRIMAGAARSLLVWIVWTALGPIVGSVLNIVQLLGFIISVFFLLTYKHAIPFPCACLAPTSDSDSAEPEHCDALRLDLEVPASGLTLEAIGRLIAAARGTSHERLVRVRMEHLLRPHLRALFGEASTAAATHGAETLAILRTPAVVIAAAAWLRAIGRTPTPGSILDAICRAATRLQQQQGAVPPAVTPTKRTTGSVTLTTNEAVERDPTPAELAMTFGGEQPATMGTSLTDSFADGVRHILRIAVGSELSHLEHDAAVARRAAASGPSSPLQSPSVLYSTGGQKQQGVPPMALAPSNFNSDADDEDECVCAHGNSDEEKVPMWQRQQHNSDGAAASSPSNGTLPPAATFVRIPVSVVARADVRLDGVPVARVQHSIPKLGPL